jgi:hypothetical protein
MMGLSRREFTALTTSAIAAPLAFTARLRAAAPVAAADLVERIKKNVGADWKAETVDTIKAGDPATMVTGIVTTAMASMAVLKGAVDAGANMVVTCEPTFFGRSDSRQPPAGRGGRGGRGAGNPPAAPPPPDPVYAAKNAFIEKHGLVVFRLNEHWRLRRPDPFTLGLGRALGWTRHQAGTDPSRYTIPAVALEALVAQIKSTLRSRGGMRVVGKPQTRVRSVALLPGSTPIAAALDVLPSVDLVVAGEVREWETVEYARDAVFSGEP